MPVLLWIVALTTLGGVVSALAASLFLAVPASARQRALPHLVSFATGALLAAALLGLIPEALERAGTQRAGQVGAALLAGILLFFLLEKLVLWRHSHGDVEDDHHVHTGHSDKASAMLVLIGTSIHNALDGVLIAAAFMTHTQLGIFTAIAIVAHEIPQEVGDLAILLHAGMSRRRALVLNLLTSLTSVFGGIVAYFALQPVFDYLYLAIALAAASFLYIAVADLIPGLHRRSGAGAGARQILFILLGVGVIYVSHRLLG
jgi:zinc and cadmium transporter